MKYSIVTLVLILLLFLITVFVGLTANKIYLETELPYGLQPPEIQPNVSPWFFIGVIIIMSGVFFLMRKFNLGSLIKLWFFVAIASCTAITLSAFIEPFIAFIVALAIVMLKFKEHDIYTHNLGEILVYGGIVAIFAPMLKLWSVIVLLIAISVYDYIAVFVTKHMIGLAKMQEEMGIFAGLIVSNKDEIAILGGGDIAFTLLFAVVVMREFGMISALFAVYGAALFIAILMMIGKKKEFYPAMPFVTIGSLLGFLISLI